MRQRNTRVLRASRRFAAVVAEQPHLPGRSFGGLSSLTGDAGARALLRAPGASLAAVPSPDRVLDLDEADPGLA